MESQIGPIRIASVPKEKKCVDQIMEKLEHRHPNAASSGRHFENHMSILKQKL